MCKEHQHLASKVCNEILNLQFFFHTLIDSFLCFMWMCQHKKDANESEELHLASCLPPILTKSSDEKSSILSTMKGRQKKRWVFTRHSLRLEMSNRLIYLSTGTRCLNHEICKHQVYTSWLSFLPARCVLWIESVYSSVVKCNQHDPIWQMQRNVFEYVYMEVSERKSLSHLTDLTVS